MDLSGCGTGLLSYQINDEPVGSGRECTVEGIEDDVSGVLQLTFAFQDPVHGLVGVGVSVYDFSPSPTPTVYVENIDVLVTMLPRPSWSSGAGSSARLSVRATPVNGGCSYSGSFDAANLTVVSGLGNALAIKFANYDVTLQPQGSDGDT